MMIPAPASEPRLEWLLRGPPRAAGARSAVHQLNRRADDAFMLKQHFFTALSVTGSDATTVSPVCYEDRFQHEGLVEWEPCRSVVLEK